MALTQSILLLSLLTYVYAQDPATIDEHGADPSDVQYFTERFSYVGCLSADLTSFTGPDSASGFAQVEESEVMYLNLCIGDCYDYAYAAIYNEQCFCSSSPEALSGMTSTLDQTCRTPCPGLLSQTCGGSVTAGDYRLSKSKEKRQKDGNLYYVTVYRNTAFVLPGTDPAVSSASASLSEGDAAPSQLIVSEGIQTTAGPPQPPVQTYGFITATAISTSYTTLCNSPMCPTAYLSETATTILVLSTNTQPPPTLTVPMSITTVSYDVVDGDGNELSTSTELSVPDESAIADIDSELQDWVTTQPDAETVWVGKSDDEVSAIAKEAGLDRDGGDGTVSPDGGNSGTGSASGSGGVTGDGGPMIERRSVVELEGRREHARRRLLDELDAEVAIGIPELHHPQRNDGKTKRSYSPFAQAALVEGDLEQGVYFDYEDGDWYEDDDEDDDDEADEENSEEGIIKRDALPDDAPSDEVVVSLPTTLNGHDVEIGPPLLLNPADNKPIRINEAEKIVHDKRDAGPDDFPIQFEIKFTPEVGEHAKRQSPVEVSAASVPLLSLSITDGGVRTIGLVGAQPSSSLNSSTAPYPMGNATVACPTATGALTLPTNSQANVAGQPTHTLGARPSTAHPVARPDKFLRYALVALCLVSTSLLGGDVLFTA